MESKRNARTQTSKQHHLWDLICLRVSRFFLHALAGRSYKPWNPLEVPSKIPESWWFVCFFAFQNFIWCSFVCVCACLSAYSLSNVSFNGIYNLINVHILQKPKNAVFSNLTIYYMLKFYNFDYDFLVFFFFLLNHSYLTFFRVYLSSDIY